ncbi:uncharacterized protein L201_007711 [Kwoniella dendrophila CBS 6074]|uniref:VWFA domain-containing protein n=1 Tax=Kwoniella dendrophila CBS 6074 TaxID=1295534 RepID=A0AAX4K5B4_9TREE
MSFCIPKSWKKSHRKSNSSYNPAIPPLQPNVPATTTFSTDITRSKSTRASTQAQPANVTTGISPPAYTPTSPIEGYRDKTGEDPLEILKEYDTVFLIDDSSSMKGTRWTEARTSLMGVADIAARYDQDGIDIQFLNSKKQGNGMRTGNQVMQLFESVKPNGFTPTGQRLEDILREYMISLEKSSRGSTMFGRNAAIKPMNLIIITDGAPSDDPESVIVTFAKRLDKGEYPLSQIGLQFLQVGNDTGAREALQELDDGLSDKYEIRDMVDTVPYCGKELTAEIIVKTLIGGINRRMDRRS